MASNVMDFSQIGVCAEFEQEQHDLTVLVIDCEVQGGGHIDIATVDVGLLTLDELDDILLVAVVDGVE